MDRAVLAEWRELASSEANPIVALYLKYARERVLLVENALADLSFTHDRDVAMLNYWRGLKSMLEYWEQLPRIAKTMLDEAGSPQAPETPWG
ncbi:MAG: hypothetical protein V2G41_09575 [bacterium JZ-2024 1]